MHELSFTKNGVPLSITFKTLAEANRGKITAKNNNCKDIKVREVVPA